MGNLLWLRIGEGGSYEDYGDDFDALTLPMREYGVKPEDINWTSHGFESYQIGEASLYWGDDDANFVAGLDDEDREMVLAALRQHWDDYPE